MFLRVVTFTLTALLLMEWCAVAQSTDQSTPASAAFMSGPSTSGANLNGHPLLDGTTILPGEQVTTGPTGTAVLARDQGGMVTLGHFTSAKVEETSRHGSNLYLQNGLVTVYGMMPVQTPQGELKPGSPGTCYEVVAQPGKTYILGISGATQVQGGDQSFPVQANQAYLLELNASGQTVATPVNANTVRSMVQSLQGDPTTKVQTASPIK